MSSLPAGTVKPTASDAHANGGRLLLPTTLADRLRPPPVTAAAGGLSVSSIFSKPLSARFIAAACTAAVTTARSRARAIHVVLWTCRSISSTFVIDIRSTTVL